MMYTAQLFESDSERVVTLPKQFALSTDEVYIHSLGDCVVITAKDAAWSTFLNGLNAFTDDFMADGR